ncbi:MAG: ATP-dependent zinc metalloprotease FtsH [Synechococcaceae cyanobacterium SM2_3_1]|nr:ATP-dependent zinc metalloprotease FtsH [Synechococcaceae cyanobacterium SM2_3_1]
MPHSPSPPEDPRRTDSEPIYGGFVRLMIMLLLISVFIPRSFSLSLVPYSQFIQQVEAGQVATAEIGTNRIRYSLKEGINLPVSGEDQAAQEFITIPIPEDSELSTLLRQHEVEYSASPPQSSWFTVLIAWLLPLFLFFMLSSMIFKRGPLRGNPSPFSVGKSHARIYSEGSTGVTFQDVAGIDEAKAELEEIVDFLQHSSKYTLLGAKIPKGVLLVGPPGTGKTLLARAIAGEARVPFFSISGSEFIEMFVGVGASRVRDLFEQAKAQAPCIVFIDELDALGKSRAGPGLFQGANDEREQTLNQLLAEMDGFDPNTGVLLLAATNRPEVLDPALLRPGRFDRQIVVDRPDKSGREAILKVHVRSVRLGNDVDLAKLAARTPGFAGADLANLVNEAALLAARHSRSAVMMADFHEALERLLTGLEKKSRVLNEREKRTVAYHEAGHAIVGSLMPGSGRVEKISIVPRGMGSLGYTLQMPEEDRFLLMEDEIRGRLVTLLAGRTAEELIFNKISTGASDDIQKATDLAERFVSLYGMSRQLGPIAFEKQAQQFLGDQLQGRRAVSPQVTEAIDREVKTLITGAQQAARDLLGVNHTLLESMAQTLLEKESLEGEELQQFLQQARPHPELQSWLDSGQTSDLSVGSTSNGKGHHSAKTALMT